MTNVEYLRIMHKKATKKTDAEAIKETCHKERKENGVKFFSSYFIIDEHFSV
jgi:hypothetical protein